MSSKEDPEYNIITERWEYEDESGQTYEKNPVTDTWVPIIDEEQVKAQQAAYSVPGVDESIERGPQNRSKKRKIQETFTSSESRDTGEKAPKKEKPASKAKETAVYIQNLPDDTKEEELASLFSKCGLLLEDPETGLPRIKIYKDANGKQKGDALVIYFREESVSLAIQMIDDTSLRGDQQLLSVSKASFDHKKNKKEVKENRPVDETVKKKGFKKAEKLRSKLADWDDEDVKEIPRTNKFDKIVILKGMFSLSELESDPTLLLDLKEDVREECSRLGEVTNVVLYDKEADGVMSVRFKDGEDALACIKLMSGRFFGGRQITADLYDGKRRYVKSGKGAGQEGEDDGQEEDQRLEKFGEWLES